MKKNNLCRYLLLLHTLQPPGKHPGRENDFFASTSNSKWCTMAQIKLVWQDDLRKRFDYVVINCGYTSRLLDNRRADNLEDLKTAGGNLENNHLVLIKDDLWDKEKNHEMTSFEEGDVKRDDIDKCGDIVNLLDLDGICVFKDLDGYEIRYAIQCLQDIGFCGCLSLDTINDVKVYESTYGSIYVVTLDTESG